MTNCSIRSATVRFALFIAVMFGGRTTKAAGDLIELKQHTAPVHTIQWSADGKRLATVCEEGLVCVWDAEGKLVSKTQIEAVEYPIVSFTPDLTRIAVVRSQDCLSRLTRRPIDGGETVVSSLPDGKPICRFNARTERIRDYPFRASIFAFELSPDGTRLAVGGSVEAAGGRHGSPGGIATIWDVERAQIIRRSTKFSTLVNSLAWTQDSDVLVIGTAGSGTELAEAGEIHAWHKNNWLPSGGKPARVFHTDFLDPLTVGKPGYADVVGVRDLRVVGDQLTALIQNADAEIVRKWDLMTGKSQSASTTEINWRSKLQLALSSGGTLVAAHKQDMAHIHNATTLKRITTVKLTSPVRSVGFDPQDTKVAIGTETGMVQIHAVKIQQESKSSEVADEGGDKAAFARQVSEKDVAAAHAWARQKLAKTRSTQPPSVQGNYSLPAAGPVDSLILYNVSVTDEELRHLAAFPKLKRLVLRGKGITDDGLKHLVTLKKLERLSLGGTSISDAGMKHLAKLQNLKRLELAGAKLTGAGIRELAGLHNLQDLSLIWSAIGDKALKDVGELKELRELNLRKTNVSDDGLKHLAMMPELREITLQSTQVTGDGLRHLSTCKSLRTINCWGTGVTSEDILRFKETLPKCEIDKTLIE